MADVRKNQNESINKAAEASRAGTREAANQTQDAVSAGVEGFKQVTDQFTRAFGFTGESEEVTRRATQNLEAVTETGSVLLRGFQDLSREWVELAQQRLQRNAEGLARLAQCRNLQDLAAVQTELVRENLREMINNTRRISERSVEVASEAARTITAETNKAAERFQRAA
jgi:phasin family protein